jgi:hypothetical protein
VTGLDRVVRVPLTGVPLHTADGTPAGRLLVGPAGDVLAVERSDGLLAWPEGHEPLRLVVGDDARLRACVPDGRAVAELGLTGPEAVAVLRAAGAEVEDGRPPPEIG